jgi:hypothetical protein
MAWRGEMPITTDHQATAISIICMITDGLHPSLFAGLIYTVCRHHPWNFGPHKLMVVPLKIEPVSVIRGAQGFAIFVVVVGPPVAISCVL